MRGHPSCRSSQLRTKIIQRGGSVFLCGFLRFSSGVPEVVLWLSYGFSLVFLSFFRGFAMFFLFCFQLFPMVSIWFLHHSLWFYHRFHHRVTRITMKKPSFPSISPAFFHELVTRMMSKRILPVALLVLALRQLTTFVPSPSNVPRVQPQMRQAEVRLVGQPQHDAEELRFISIYPLVI